MTSQTVLQYYITQVSCHLMTVFLALVISRIRVAGLRVLLNTFDKHIINVRVNCVKLIDSCLAVTYFSSNTFVQIITSLTVSNKQVIVLVGKLGPINLI